MRIGIDCRTIQMPSHGKDAGIGHYVYFLVKHLVEHREHEFVLFCEHGIAAEVRREFATGHPNVSVRSLPFSSIKRHLPFVYSHMIISAAFYRANIDLLHAPANSMPLFWRGPAVVTVHDLAIYAHPEWFPGDIPGAQSFAKRITVPRSLRRARRIIAVSKTTRHDIEKIFNIDPKRIAVVHEGCELPEPVNSRPYLAKDGLVDKKFILFLGTIEPRKNISTLVNAFVSAAETGLLPDNLDLVIAGARGWKFSDVFTAIDVANATFIEKKLNHSVRYLGYLPDDEKPAVISAAAAFVFPSLYEGFGLPPLEAMSLGVPVIASTGGALPEILHDAAILVNPHETQALAEAIVKVTTDPILVADLVRRGYERVSQMTWQKCAENTLNVYEIALRQSDPAEPESLDSYGA